jgi:hypothetical protein
MDRSDPRGGAPERRQHYLNNGQEDQKRGKPDQTPSQGARQGQDQKKYDWHGEQVTQSAVKLEGCRPKEGHASQVELKKQARKD